MFFSLVHAGEREEVITLLLKFLPKLSENTCEALTAYFVRGYDAHWIKELYGINQQNLTRAISKLDAVYANYQALRDAELNHLSDVKKPIIQELTQ